MVVAGPTAVMILGVNMDYLRELTMHSFCVHPLLVCKGNIQHLIYSQLGSLYCTLWVMKNDLEMLLHTCTIVIHLEWIQN